MAKTFQSACVTGGAGFIGSHLVENLLQRGVAVTVLDDLSVGRRENVPAGARLVVGNLLDPKAAEEALAGCQALFHLAARVAIRSSFEFAVEDAQTNLAGTASILRAAARAGSVRKVVAASSMAVYADAPERKPVPENHATAPISPYGVSKLAAERLTHLLSEQSGMQSVVLRLFNTYGPRQALSPYVGVVTIFINRLLSGEQPVIYGDGEQCRDFVHARDVATGFLAAMEAEVSGETCNIGSGQARTVNQVLASLQRVMKTASLPQHVQAVPGELRYSVADITKARRLLGYHPVHDFESSVSAVVDEIRLRARSAVADQVSIR